MRTAYTTSGEKVSITENRRDIGHGIEVRVIYSDNSYGWEHESDLLK